MGRSAGPNGPAPGTASSSSRSSSGSLTPMSGPNRPMNMLPCTNAPRFPNIGLTSTSGASGTRPLKRSRSASVGLGICIGSHLPRRFPPGCGQRPACIRHATRLVACWGPTGRPDLDGNIPSPLYALWVILEVMTTTFEVLAEPSRRAIMDLLLAGERPVGELVSELHMSQPAVSRHLRVLRDAGLVRVRVDAQRRLYRIEAEPLRAMDEWLAPYRRLWAARLDALSERLDAMEESR